MLEKAETMPEAKSEVDSFFDGLPTEDKKIADIFGPSDGSIEGAIKASEEEEPAGGKSEEDDEPRKNRRHRRLEAQLQNEREEKATLAARIAALENAPKSAPDDVDPRLVRMYGADNIEAAKLHQELLNDAESRAEERALTRMKSSQAEEAAQEREYQTFITGELEAIEDAFDVDLTSNAPAARKTRSEFLDLVEKLSPKDAGGDVVGFADFESTWDVYQSRKKEAPASRAKEVAARTMQKSGNPAPAQQAPTPGFDGWKKDLGLG